MDEMMKYRKSEAKDYAAKRMKGLWGATLTPFTPDYKIDESGFRHNLRHCIDELQMEGMFLNGLMGEAFNQTMAERKRIMDITMEESKDDMVIMPYTSDPSVENTLELTRYAEAVGAEFAIIINPLFYFGAMTEEGVFQYFKYIADRVNIAIALFNQVAHGYLMNPRLICRLAEIVTIVAVKDIAPAPDIYLARALCPGKFIISDADTEENWLINLTVNDQPALIANPMPFVMQSKKLKLMREYTEAATRGEIANAWEAYKRLAPIRKALSKVIPAGKKQATYKYWTQFLGMAGGDGRVRMPMQELTNQEKREIEAAVKSTELV
jgi:4-hydroxy-tetrahydrodipicolinate synthase